MTDFLAKLVKHLPTFGLFWITSLFKWKWLWLIFGGQLFQKLSYFLFQHLVTLVVDNTWDRLSDFRPTTYPILTELNLPKYVHLPLAGLPKPIIFLKKKALSKALKKLAKKSGLKVPCSSGQPYKHFTNVIYDPRVIKWCIFKSGTTLESKFTSVKCL